MAIVGDHPSHGVRFVLTQDDDATVKPGEAPRLRYVGDVFTPTERHRIELDVAEDGSVEVRSEAPPDLAEKARLLVRTVVRHARSEGTAPPRRIQRWRGEK